MRGLSPRGRGKPSDTEKAKSIKRSIPAWAGETRCTRKIRIERQVYPRVGGGNWRPQRAVAHRRGLSPRGRGKPAAIHPYHRATRSIPAWAGETGAIIDASRRPRVYPRVGGGNRAPVKTEIYNDGLSPRGRGKPVLSGGLSAHVGSIPAWAGETRKRAAQQHPPEVYPRVGGGNSPTRTRTTSSAGLSPRGRGKPAQAYEQGRLCGSIPAWAGETRTRAPLGGYLEVYPRVGGGNCVSQCIPPFRNGLSPRGRGKQLHYGDAAVCARSIPAWAGETQKLPTTPTKSRVYPRVGGGNHFRAAA